MYRPVIIYRILSNANDNSPFFDWKKTNIEVNVKGFSCSHTMVVSKTFEPGKIILNSGGPVAAAPILIQELSKGSINWPIKIIQYYGHFLDIGAGLGFFVECCSRFGIKCTGIEGSQFGVNKAKERDIDLIHFIIDKTPLPFASQSISTVLMSEFIEHVPKKIAMFILSECYRVLEKKGVIIILTPSRYNSKVNKDPKHINLYSKDTIKEEVVNARFHFEKYIKDSPRTILTHTSFEYFLMRQIYRFYKPSFLSQSAACVAVKL